MVTLMKDGKVIDRDLPLWKAEKLMQTGNYEWKVGNILVEKPQEDSVREDCNRNCKGYHKYVNGKRTECCGGCPFQCNCIEKEDYDEARQSTPIFGVDYDDEEDGSAEEIGDSWAGSEREF